MWHAYLLLAGLLCPPSTGRLATGARPVPQLGRRQLAAAAAAAGASAAAALGAGAAPEPSRDATFERVGQTQGTPEGAGAGAAFVTLPSGVQIKAMRAGPGTGPAVAAGSAVVVELNAFALNLNGVRFYSTKLRDGTPEPLAWVVGDGRAVPGLEDGLLGMRKGDVRRIIVPPALGYGAPRPGGGKGADYFLPKPRDAVDRNALNAIVDNPNRDATVMFDVRLNQVK